MSLWLDAVLKDDKTAVKVLPGEGRPGSVEIMAPRRHVELDVVKLIQVIDDVSTQVGLHEGAACVVPVTESRYNRGWGCDNVNHRSAI